jgi:Uncharacterized BCR, YaiI/YqxD family COG1671
LGADVVAPHGKRFTESSIGMALATRNLMDHLRPTEQTTSGPKASDPATFKFPQRARQRRCAAAAFGHDAFETTLDFWAHETPILPQCGGTMMRR